jgi:hypothetical protein
LETEVCQKKKKKNETMNRKGNRGASKPRDLLPENINLKLVP